MKVEVNETDIYFRSRLETQSQLYRFNLKQWKMLQKIITLYGVYGQGMKMKSY